MSSKRSRLEQSSYHDNGLTPEEKSKQENGLNLSLAKALEVNLSNATLRRLGLLPAIKSPKNNR